MSDKQLNGFLRLLIRDVKRIIATDDAREKHKLLKELLEDLQDTLDE